MIYKKLLQISKFIKYLFNRKIINNNQNNMVRLGNYIKKSSLNSETKEIVNIREFNDTTQNWVTDLGLEIPEYVLLNQYIYLDTGFNYTNTKKLKPLQFGDLDIQEESEESIEPINDYTDDVSEIKQKTFKTTILNDLSKKPVFKSEQEILFDSVISKAYLTESKIINFKPKQNKKQINKLSINLSFDYDVDMLINSMEFLDINVKEFTNYLTEKLIDTLKSSKLLNNAVLNVFEGNQINESIQDVNDTVNEPEIYEQFINERVKQTIKFYLWL